MMNIPWGLTTREGSYTEVIITILKLLQRWMFTIYEGNSYQLEALFEYNAAYILNSDGSVKGQGGPAAWGGFLSLNGRWLCGFERKIGRTTSYIAELWGVHEGLCLIQRKSLIGVEIQVDAEEAVYKSILGEKVVNVGWGLFKLLKTSWWR